MIREPEIVAVKKFSYSEDEYSIVVEWNGRDYFFTLKGCKDELDAYQEAVKHMNKRKPNNVR